MVFPIYHYITHPCRGAKNNLTDGGSFTFEGVTKTKKWARKAPTWLKTIKAGQRVLFASKPVGLQHSLYPSAKIVQQRCFRDEGPSNWLDYILLSHLSIFLGQGQGIKTLKDFLIFPGFPPGDRREGLSRRRGDRLGERQPRARDSGRKQLLAPLMQDIISYHIFNPTTVHYSKYINCNY